MSHDINADAEVWTMRHQIGEKALSVWLEFLSIADRNEGELPGDSEELIRLVAGRCQATKRTVSAVYQFAVSRLWLTCQPTLRVSKWGKYHRTEEQKKVPSEPSEPDRTRPNHNKEKNKTPPSAAFDPPDWVKIDTWRSFEEMRRRERHPLTRKACELVVGDLEKLRAGGHDPNECLERSILNGWRGVFAPNGDRTHKSDVLANKTKALFERKFLP